MTRLIVKYTEESILSRSLINCNIKLVTRDA